MAHASSLPCAFGACAIPSNSMAEPLRAAVIGLGSMGANHARVLGDTPGVELVAVADADPERVKKAIGGRPIPGFPDAATLLRETRPALVSIVVPTQLHEAVAIEAIAASLSGAKAALPFLVSEITNCRPSSDERVRVTSLRAAKFLRMRLR